MNKDYEKEANKLVNEFRKHAYSYVEISGVSSDIRNDETWNATQCAIICLEEKIKAIGILPAYKIYSKDLHAATEQVRGYKKQIEYLKSKK